MSINVVSIRLLKLNVDKIEISMTLIHDFFFFIQLLKKNNLNDPNMSMLCEGTAMLLI